MAAPDSLRSPAPPWVHLVVLSPGEKPGSMLPAPPGFAVRTVDGRRARSKRALLDELARVFEFPAGSGRNWDAVEEMLADLEWLPAKGYLLIVTDADELLADDPDDYEIFISVITDVAKEWASPRRGTPARPALAFHLCLTVARDRVDARASWGGPRLGD